MKIDRVALLFVCVSTSACAESPAPAVAPAAPTTAPPPEPKTSVSAAPTPSAPPPAQSGKCQRDADCDKKSLYCAESPCACVAFPVGGPQPACRDPKAQVQCFVDPCLRKVVKCDHGACVIDSAPTQ